ncbi:MarR family winged helix-turn-helix transcriptional regulator [Sphingomonas oryzagri]
MTRLLDGLLREQGTSIARMTVLTNVARHGPISLTDLAVVCGCSRRTASVAVDPLVMEELLRRDPGSRDRRIRCVTITEAGLAELRTSEPICARS